MKKDLTKGRFDKDALVQDFYGILMAIYWTFGPQTWLKLKGWLGFLLAFVPLYGFAKWKKNQALSTAALAMGATHLIYYLFDKKLKEETGYRIWQLDPTIEGLANYMPNNATIKTLPSGEQVVFYAEPMNDYVGVDEPMMGEYIGPQDQLMGMNDYLNQEDQLFARDISEFKFS